MVSGQWPLSYSVHHCFHLAHPSHPRGTSMTCSPCLLFHSDHYFAHHILGPNMSQISYDHPPSNTRLAGNEDVICSFHFSPKYQGSPQQATHVLGQIRALAVLEGMLEGCITPHQTNRILIPSVVGYIVGRRYVNSRALQDRMRFLSPPWAYPLLNFLASEPIASTRQAPSLSTAYQSKNTRRKEQR